MNGIRIKRSRVSRFVTPCRASRAGAGDLPIVDPPLAHLARRQQVWRYGARRSHRWSVGHQIAAPFIVFEQSSRAFRQRLVRSAQRSTCTHPPIALRPSGL